MKQAIPPSITGKGAGFGFAQGGSVLDHSFGKGEPYTLGVEEEYMLLDAETFDLVQHVDTVLAAVAGHELEERINAELMQSVIEGGIACFKGRAPPPRSPRASVDRSAS